MSHNYFLTTWFNLYFEPQLDTKQLAKQKKVIAEFKDKLNQRDARIAKLEKENQELKDKNAQLQNDLDACNIPPTIKHTGSPTNNPSTPPSKAPTQNPSATPSLSPTNNPSASPSKSPTQIPSITPTISPSSNPTSVPSKTPSATPTHFPTSLETSFCSRVVCPIGNVCDEDKRTCVKVDPPPFCPSVKCPIDTVCDEEQRACVPTGMSHKYFRRIYSIYMLTHRDIILFKCNMSNSYCM